MKALIIANGEIPSQKFIRRLIKGVNVVICADGGANTARKLKILPDLIIGDFDSIAKSSIKYFKGIQQIVINDQDSTDLEKAIKYCIENNISDIDIVGASGKRTDHTVGNLGCFKKFKKLANLRMIDENGILFGIDKFVRLKTSIGEIISLIPLNRCVGVKTKNLKYKLNGETLEIGVREGTHNIATGKFVEVSLKKGDLLIYRLLRD
ncbi:MAG: thiamine pyrophosphokinase [Ignavibacteriae bacterium]|nr:MAG: thiamine pyrophosphokinase [Ignavibacteriota bacterium]